MVYRRHSAIWVYVRVDMVGLRLGFLRSGTLRTWVVVRLMFVGRRVLAA